MDQRKNPDQAGPLVEKYFPNDETAAAVEVSPALCPRTQPGSQQRMQRGDQCFSNGVSGKVAPRHR